MRVILIVIIITVSRLFLALLICKYHQVEYNFRCQVGFEKKNVSTNHTRAAQKRLASVSSFFLPGPLLYIMYASIVIMYGHCGGVYINIFIVRVIDGCFTAN